MAKLARIKNGTVDNVIVGDPADFPDLTDVTGTSTAPGHIDNGDGTFSPPASQPPSWSSLDFLRRFTQPERVTVRTAAKQDAVIEDFLALVNKADTVHSDDADVIAGMQYLVDQGHITATRRDEILGGS